MSTAKHVRGGHRPPAAVLLLGVGLLLLGMTAPVQAADGCDEALGLFEEGERHFKTGAFAKAVTSLEQALTLCERPVLHYNLGRAHEGLGQLEQAIAAFQAYLKAAPDADDRGGIEKRIATMQAQLREEARLREQQRLAAHRLDAQTATEPLSVVPWVMGGVGIATLGVAIGLGAASRGLQDDAVRAPTHQAAVAALDDGQRFATAANVSFVVGGLLAAGGATWLLLDLALGSAPHDPTVSVAPGRIALHGCF